MRFIWSSLRPASVRTQEASQEPYSGPCSTKHSPRVAATWRCWNQCGKPQGGTEGDPSQREVDSYVSSGRASPRLACSQMAAWPMGFSRVWIWPSISWTHQFGLGSCHCSFSPRRRCSGNTGVARTDPTAGGRETTPVRYQLCFYRAC